MKHHKKKNSRPRHMAPNNCEERSFEIENIKNCASNPMFWYSLEMSLRDNSKEYPQHRIWKTTN